MLVFEDNCDFEFECPMLWENLNSQDYGGDLSGNAFERVCDKCQKTVYRGIISTLNFLLTLIMTRVNRINQI